MRYKILSLLDITKTAKSQDEKLHAQFSNYMTFENSLLLRSNMSSISSVVSEMMDITNLKFGENYQGEHRVWHTTIEPEFPDAVSLDTLKNDFDLVPMLTGLDETIKIKNLELTMNGFQKRKLKNLLDQLL